MTTPKPPVPSDLVAQARHFLLRLQPNLIDGRRVLDELGDSIECAESCLRENIAQRNEADARANAADRRIVELEVEVAELREKLGQAHSEQGHLNNIANNYADESAKAPHRTPELTERVAAMIWSSEIQGYSFALCVGEDREERLAFADAVLDLVFGKKDE